MTSSQAFRLSVVSLALALGVCLFLGGGVIGVLALVFELRNDAVGSAVGVGAVALAFVLSWPVLALTLGQGGLYPFFGYVASAVLRVLIAVALVLIAVWLGETPPIATLMSMASLYLVALFAELFVLYRGLIQAANAPSPRVPEKN